MMIGAASAEAIFFAFLRLSAFFVVLPFPGRLVPVPAKVALSGTLAFFLAVEPTQSSFGWGAAMLEVLLGLAAGFLLRMVVESFTFGGELAGTQMGLASIGFFNPLETQLTLLGSGFTFLALGLFAAGDGPLHLMAFLARWFELVPVAQAHLLSGLLEVVQRVGTEMFELAVSAAAPMIASIFCAQMILAVLARSVPTLNLLIEGPGMTIAAGTIGLFASVHTFGRALLRAFDIRFEQILAWWGG
jgi:flagellar biosynthetic protein FliR